MERKDLAEKTKVFRRLEDQAKLGEIKGLLKAYQSYIDLVSTQSKSVQNAFLQVYSSLSEAPDPYPLLEASVDSLVVADETVPKLQGENQHLQSRVAKLTAQLEESEKRLDQETRARQEEQSQTDAKVKEVENSWSKVLTEKQDNWSAKEKSLEERAENQERLLKELKASYEVSQRLDRGQDGDSAGQATSVELEIVQSDLERTNMRLAEVEARNEQLRVELAQSTTQSVASKSSSVEDDPAYLRLRSENSALMRKSETLRFERESAQRENENATRSLRRELSGLKQDGESLRAKIKGWSDYEDLKRELEVLKTIEFTTGYTEADGSDGPAKGSEQNLEQLMMARNKKLNDELTLLRVAHQDLTAKLETLQQEHSTSIQDLERSQALTQTLENDLSRMQSAAPSGPAASVAGSMYASRYAASSHPRRGPATNRVSPTSSIISGFDTGRDLGGSAEGGAGAAGILPMVTAQRDRFKKRNAELEAELRKIHGTVTSLRAEVQALQKDNLNLYEKTRYAATYARGAPSPAAALNTNPSTVSIGSPGTLINDNPSGSGSGGGVFDRYKSAYESNISPFAAFRGRESAWAFRRMSLPERGLLQVTKVIFANRLSRNLFALYLLSLHVVIATMFYHV